MIKIERIYTKPADMSGYRLLIDRLWPRGISKVNAALDDWDKAIAPSDDLRKWFDHDPAKFIEFTQRYRTELGANPHTVDFIETAKNQLAQGDVILLFGAKDETHNQAVVLQDYLNEKLA